MSANKYTLCLPSNGMDYKLPFRRATAIVIEQYDWYYPQVVCLKPQPVLRPDLFTHKIRAFHYEV